MAAKAHAARRLRLASGKLACETFPQAPQAGPHEAANDYVSRRLARVRAQLDMVDKAFETEATKATPDGQRLNWLAQAQERLAEQERVLDNRPLPGSRRPGKADVRPMPPRAWLARPVPVLAKDRPLDSLPVEPPTPAPTITPTPPPAPSVEPVPIEVALRHRPGPLPTPATPAPPGQKPG